MEKPTLNLKISGTLVAKDPEGDQPGIALILVEGGEVRWAAFKEEAPVATELPPPPPPPAA